MKRTQTLGMTIAILLATTSAVRADTLREALAAAYTSNPDLQAQRAALRATDEGVARAFNSFLPSVSGSGAFENRSRDIPGLPSFTATQKFYEARVDQNIFRGFQDYNTRREQESLVRAGRAFLASQEQQTLLDAVTVYMDVVRDVAVLELTNNNVQVLERQLEASRDRFRVGEITRTDVAQSEARLAGAVSARFQAEADLAASRARYERIVGRAPGTLDQPPDLPPLPQTLDEAIAIGLDEGPQIEQARYNEQAARHAVTVARGAMLPTVNGFLRISKFSDANFSPNVGTTVPFSQVAEGAGVQINIPLYQGGAEYSDVRRAKQIRSQRMLEIRSAQRQVAELARAAFETYRAAGSSIESNRAQVRANEIALEGVRQEAAVGSRTTLDVLDAEQELLDARVNLVRAERDEYVAGFALLSAVGRLNAVSLDLPVERYDPREYYRSVKWKFLGWGID